MSVSVRSDNLNETVPVVISEHPYVFNPDADFSGNGNTECICGVVRYCPLSRCDSCKSSEIAAYRVSAAGKELVDDKGKAKTATWFHATRVENWDKKIFKSGATVHIGDEATATELADDHFNNELSFFEDKEELREYTLYEITLKPEASISDVVCNDLVYNWTKDTDAFAKLVGDDFVRYVNTYESSGAVSMIGNPNMFTIVRKSVRKSKDR